MSLIVVSATVDSSEHASTPSRRCGGVSGLCGSRLERMGVVMRSEVERELSRAAVSSRRVSVAELEAAIDGRVLAPVVRAVPADVVFAPEPVRRILP